MIEQLVNWHLRKHLGFNKQNVANTLSQEQLAQLQVNILKPLTQSLGEIEITYGFTSHALLRYILTTSPGDMAPDIDQHASMELNSKGNRICKRDGAACDFYIKGYEHRMDEVARYICKHLKFDLLYYYGKDCRVHISIGPDNSQYALIRKARSDGLRVNIKSAKGRATQTFFDDL